MGRSSERKDKQDFSAVTASYLQNCEITTTLPTKEFLNNKKGRKELIQNALKRNAIYQQQNWLTATNRK